MKRVAIVGGGIAGLAVAYALRSRSAPGEIDVTLYEKGDRCGGNLRSERINGFLCEWAANGFLDNSPPTLDLARAVGLEPSVLRSNDSARRRFIFRDRRLHAIPGGPLAFARSGMLSWRGKLRVMGEPFARSRPPVDESIHEFAARRIGREAAEIMIDSMVSGIFAGDARRLSLKACFPKMWDMETQYGGLVRALVAKQWSRRRERRSGSVAIGAPAGTLTSFREGTEALPRALVASLADSVCLEALATRLDFANGRLQLSVRDRGVCPADAVVLAGPALQSAVLVASLDEHLAHHLADIETAPIVVVCLGYDAAGVERERGALDGFGFLIPRVEGRRALGVLWDSSIFPNRAPEGAALIRVMLGGARDRGALNLSDADVLNVVRSDVRETMGLARPPDFVKIIRHRVGIPQCTIGHLDRLAEIEDRLSRIPGLYLAGNSYYGPSINACIAEAGPLADRVLERLRGSTGVSEARASRTRQPSADRIRDRQPSIS
jgi:oxygen-dependent protoporphyrinogen oxidase